MKLKPGTGMLIYTDGVSEAEDRDKNLFGEKRIVEVLHEHKYDPVRELSGRLIAQVDLFANATEQSDDITLFILSYK
jgi:sigma-B regulation protein RsbU (phosphoserine phosphatase)